MCQVSSQDSEWSGQEHAGWGQRYMQIQYKLKHVNQKARMNDRKSETDEERKQDDD